MRVVVVVGKKGGSPAQSGGEGVMAERGGWHMRGCPGPGGGGVPSPEGGTSQFYVVT